MDAAGIQFLLTQEPEEPANNIAAGVEGTRGVLVYLARQKPTFGLSLQIRQADRDIRFCETRS